MSIGITTYKANGTPMITPDGAGGIYVETWRQSAGQPAVRAYSGLRGMSLRVFQVMGGVFAWVVGQDGHGNPTITFSFEYKDAYGGDLILLVFAS